MLLPSSCTTAAARPLAARCARETLHLLCDLPVGVAGSLLIVAAFSAGSALAVTLVGIPLVAVTVVLARFAARGERARAHVLLDVALDAPPAAPRASTWPRRLIASLRDTVAWRAAAYFLLLLPVGTATFSAVVAWWSTALFLLTLPAWAWALPHDGPAAWWAAPWQLASASLAGLLLVAAAPFAVHAITRADRLLLRLLNG